MKIARLFGALTVVAALAVSVDSAAGASGWIARRRLRGNPRIVRIPWPGAGCFSASYPTLAWKPTSSQVAPAVPFPPALSASSEAGKSAVPATVGNGTDYSAGVAGLMSSARGLFENVSANITETGRYNDQGSQLANTFSLQLNTQFFTTPACSGAQTPGNCMGWQQFLYDTHSNDVFMQYWLINYVSTCPSGVGHVLKRLLYEQPGHCILRERTDRCRSGHGSAHRIGGAGWQRHCRVSKQYSCQQRRQLGQRGRPGRKAGTRPSSPSSVTAVAVRRTSALTRHSKQRPP